MSAGSSPYVTQMTQVRRRWGPSGPLSFARVWRPCLRPQDMTLCITELQGAGHFHRLATPKQSYSMVNAVFDNASSRVDQLDAGHLVAVDPAAESKESRPAPAAKVRPCVRLFRVRSTPGSATRTAGCPPSPIRLLDGSVDVSPCPAFSVFKLERHHGIGTLDALLHDLDGRGTSLIWMPTPIHSCLSATPCSS